MIKAIERRNREAFVGFLFPLQTVTDLNYPLFYQKDDTFLSNNETEFCEENNLSLMQFMKQLIFWKG